MTLPAVMTPQEVARLLRMSAGYVYQHADEIGCVRIGTAVRFRRETVQEYLKRMERKERVQ